MRRGTDLLLGALTAIAVWAAVLGAGYLIYVAVSR